MVSVTTVILTIIGGLIAGLIGLLTTKVSLRDQRKQMHLKEHKNNLLAVREALDQIRKDVWPLIGSAEELKLPQSPFGNLSLVQNLKIKDVPVIMHQSILSLGRNETFQLGIDSILYDDIPSHFRDLDKLLEKTENKFNKSGSTTLKLLNDLSEIIYNKLNNVDIDFPSIPIRTEKGFNPTTTKFKYLSDEDKLSNAGYIFLMVIGEDEDKWQNNVERLKNMALYDKLKKLSEEIINEFGGDLNQLRELRDQIFRNINETKEEIDKIEHTTKLKGRSMYI